MHRFSLLRFFTQVCACPAPHLLGSAFSKCFLFFPYTLPNFSGLSPLPALAHLCSLIGVVSLRESPPFPGFFAFFPSAAPIYPLVLFLLLLSPPFLVAFFFCVRIPLVERCLSSLFGVSNPLRKLVSVYFSPAFPLFDGFRRRFSPLLVRCFYPQIPCPLFFFPPFFFSLPLFHVFNFPSRQVFSCFSSR